MLLKKNYLSKDTQREGCRYECFYEEDTAKEYKLLQKRMDRDEDMNQHTRVNARLAYFIDSKS